MKTSRKLFLTGIIISLTVWGSLNAQSIPDNIRTMFNKRLSVDSISKFFSSEKNNFDPVIIRKIDAGHMQCVASYNNNKIYYNILLQGDKDGIYLAIINRTDLPETDNNLKNILFIYDTARLMRFIATHDSIYNTSTSIVTFKNFVLNRFGRGCGFAGIYTEKYGMMSALVHAKNTASLRKWLQHPDYETKVLGAKGLLMLKNLKTITLSPEDLSIINHLKKINLPVNYCSGCTDWSPKYSGWLLGNALY